jgi:hypothetical protein
VPAVSRPSSGTRQGANTLSIDSAERAVKPAYRLCQPRSARCGGRHPWSQTQPWTGSAEKRIVGRLVQQVSARLCAQAGCVGAVRQYGSTAVQRSVAIATAGYSYLCTRTRSRVLHTRIDQISFCNSPLGWNHHS